MFNSFNDTLGFIQGFAVMVFLTYLIFAVLGFLAAKFAKENSLVSNYLSFLYLLSTKETLLVNSHIIRILFLIWLVVYNVIMYQMYIITFILIVLITLILTRDFKRVVSNFVTGVATLLCLYVMSMLLDYNNSIYYLWTNEVIYYLLATFIILYNVSEVLKDFISISALRRFKLEDEELFKQDAKQK